MSMDTICKETLGALLFENIALRAQNVELQTRLAEFEKKLDALTPKDVPTEKGDGHVPAKH